MSLANEFGASKLAPGNISQSSSRLERLDDLLTVEASVFDKYFAGVPPAAGATRPGCLRASSLGRNGRRWPTWPLAAVVHPGVLHAQDRGFLFLLEPGVDDLAVRLGKQIAAAVGTLMLAGIFAAAIPVGAYGDSRVIVLLVLIAFAVAFVWAIVNNIIFWWREAVMAAHAIQRWFSRRRA